MTQLKVEKANGPILLSVLLKANNPYWGATNEISDEVNNYFYDNPAVGIRNFLIQAESSGIDEESLFFLSMLYDYPNLKSDIFKLLTDNKNITIDLDSFMKNFSEQLDFAQTFPFISKINSLVDEDVLIKKADNVSYQKRINDINDFFKPSDQVPTVVLIGTSPLAERSTGRSIAVADLAFISSAYDNSLNFEHEYMHTFINPIVNRILEKLPFDFQKQVVDQASPILIDDYGNNPQVLLSEELIRTYTRNFARNEPPETLESFLVKIAEITETDFDNALKNNSNLQTRLAILSIKSLGELRLRAEEYYQTFERNALLSGVYQSYDEYAASSYDSYEDYLTSKYILTASDVPISR